MKCQNCGKNEATFYYKSNINGSVTEQHLCSECAKALGYADNIEQSFANFGRSMFGGFDSLFAPMPALAGNFFEPFEAMNRSISQMFPMLGSGGGPMVQTTETTPSAANSSGNDLVSEEEHRKLNQERQLNALRNEMQQAIASENFEKAAQLRDQIHGLKQQN